jgi:hypothetical protein
MQNRNETVEVSVASERAESVAGLLITVVAAVMAIAQLFGNDLEQEMMIAHNRHNSDFSWYQSKSIKQSLKESELATLETMSMSLGAKNFTDKIEKVKAEIEKYKLEKTEILEGSLKVGKENWVQDLDGKMGVLYGVKKWERKAEVLELASNKFDLATMFFQISLVLGAVCIIIYDNPLLQRTFIILMVLIAVLGVGFSLWGYKLGQV